MIEFGRDRYKRRDETAGQWTESELMVSASASKLFSILPFVTLLATVLPEAVSVRMKKKCSYRKRSLCPRRWFEQSES